MENLGKENMEEVKVLEAQIELLQNEIAELQQQQQQDNIIPSHFRGQMREAMSYICGQKKAGKKEAVLSGLKEQVEELEDDLKLQTQMNGITLDSCSIKTLKSTGRNQVQQFCVSGHCSDLAFQVEFHLNNIQESKRTISELNVVMDVSDLQNFSSFLSGVEESQDLLLFFRTLRTYTDRCDERRRTFQHFQEKYPSVVSLPGGCRSEVMTLSHPELSGCVLFVHWSVNVLVEGVVSPKVELLTKIPEQALQLSSSQSVAGAADAFQGLLRILGPEAAIESVIMAVGLSQDA